MLPTLELAARRKAYLFGLLEAVGQRLDPTPTEHERATTSYEAVATWLVEAESEYLKSSSVSPHGSFRLQTVNRPLKGTEIDVDLLLVLPDLSERSNPKAVKHLAGDRLKESERYRPILVEKNRCWRIEYAGQFHLDVTPAIQNPRCKNGGLLVPDKSLQVWKATNPIGYANIFEARSRLQPRYRSVEFAVAKADIEGLPTPKKDKGVLKRGVQLCKRDRDIFFSTRDSSLAPISVIITTLLSWSYEACVNSRFYDHDLDLLIESVRGMPNFIQTMQVGGSTLYVVANETTDGENFAEKWNDDQRLVHAFFQWHAHAVKTLEKLVSLQGEDEVSKHLQDAYGASVVEPVFAEITRAVSASRTARTLGVLGGLGVSSSSRATPVLGNNFYGRR